MAEYEYSKHAYYMLEIRGIQEAWVKETVGKPERTEQKDDGTVHYIKQIVEFGGRYLRVVINQDADPKRIVTLFFDRKLGARL